MATEKIVMGVSGNAINKSGNVNITTSNATGTWSSTQWGVFMSVQVNLNVSVAIAAGGTIQGTLTGMPSGYVPLTRGVSWASASAQFINLDSSGVLFVRVIAAQANVGATISDTILFIRR